MSQPMTSRYGMVSSARLATRRRVSAYVNRRAIQPRSDRRSAREAAVQLHTGRRVNPTGRHSTEADRGRPRPRYPPRWDAARPRRTALPEDNDRRRSHAREFDDSAARRCQASSRSRNGNFIGVVAEREEQQRASQAIEATWTPGDPLPAHDQIYDLLREMPIAEDEGGEIAQRRRRRGTGSCPDTGSNLSVPLPAHAMMGPSCAVADVRSDGATIYSQSQNVFNLGTTVADLLGLAPEQVHVIFREGAGCYGHSGFDDVAADAALLSQAVGRPVRCSGCGRTSLPGSQRAHR